LFTLPKPKTFQLDMQILFFLVNRDQCIKTKPKGNTLQLKAKQKEQKENKQTTTTTKKAAKKLEALIASSHS